VKHVEYLDGYQYTGGELNFFPHPEGYVNVTLGTTGNRIFNYVYNYTDHLGNIRLTYTKDKISNELKILDENHYYPFGLKHQKYTNPGSLVLKAIDESTARPGYATSTDFMYKYNGKEFQDELGLNMYAMDMRHYDPAIARWVVHDPITHFYQSPYSAFDGNPVFWADPSGESVSESVFENLGGTQTGSFTDMATGTSIGAGGAGDNKQNPHKSNASQKNNSSNNYSFSDIVWEEGDSNAVELEEVVITDMNQLEKALEDRIVNQAYPIWNNTSSSNGKAFERIMWGVSAYDLVHNHKTYPTTQGVVKDIYKLNGKPRSARAAKFATTSKLVKGLGVAGFGSGMFMDGIGLKNGTTSWGKFGLNTTMGSLGFTGWGTTASLTYGLAEAFHPQGAVGALIDMGEIQRVHREQNNGAGFKPKL